MMDSIVEDPTLPINFDMSLNMSQFPNTSGFATPTKTGKEQTAATPNSEVGVIYPAVLKVVGERLSPNTNHNMKDYSTQISDLKKENFSLKLRIFYMEERMQEQFDGDHEQLLKMNIELKVECDSLKKELQDKNDLLIKASNAVACMESAAPGEMQRARSEAEQEVIQLREMMNDKVQFAEKELRAAKQDAEDCLQKAFEMRKQLETINEEKKQLLDELQQEKDAAQILKDQLAAKTPDDWNPEEQRKKLEDLTEQLTTINDELESKESIISQLKSNLSSKQTLIELLNEEKESVYSQEVLPLQKEAENLRKKLKETEENLRGSQKREDASQTAYQEHITEQQQKLDEYELATKQITDELEKREKEVKDLKEALKDTEDVIDELKAKVDTLAEESKDSEDQLKKDVNKRDRAITGLTQILKKKEQELDKLTEELRRFEVKEEEFLTTISKLERQKPQTTSKDSLITALRSQLKESDAALQDALDEKLHSEDEHEKFKRETNNQLREKDRLLESLQTQLTDYAESVSILDVQIKEKDAELQSVTNQYKALLRQLKAKEEECIKALRERDEWQQLFEEEKEKFADMARRTLRRRSSSEFGSLQSLAERESKSNLLEQKLKLSEQALQEAIESKQEAWRKFDEVQAHLARALEAREVDSEKARQKLAHQDVRIHKLEELLKDKEHEYEELETRLKSELEKTRDNRKLQDILANRQKSKDTHSQQNESSSEEERDSATDANNFCLQQQIHKLLKKIANKDKIIKDLKQRNGQRFYTSFHEDLSSESKTSSDEGDDDYDFQYHSSYHYLPSKSKQRKSRSPKHLLKNKVANDGWNEEPTREPRVTAENVIGNQSHFNTFIAPLDQTSYLGMPDGYRKTPGHDSDQSFDNDSNITALRQILQETREELSKAIRETADLRKVCDEQNRKLQELQIELNNHIAEKNDLVDQLHKTDDKMMEKESEILGLLARIKDIQTGSNHGKNDDKEINGMSGDDDFSVASSQHSRILSGDESDGMSSLKRRELCDVISNLRKKLHNAEKVNNLLKQDLQHQSEVVKQQADISMANPKLVDDLSAEVERLKAKLDESERTSTNTTKASLKKGSTLLRSKLPVLKDKVGSIGNTLQQELERSRLQNRKLNERLAATEQTVRQQADKLNKCSQALREAGIASPPSSPIRAARSVPNLFQGYDSTLPPHLPPYDGGKTQDHSSSSSSHTSDVGTQTSATDSGIVTVSPKIEQKYNSLIQAQAKELSEIRQQIKKACEGTVSLDSEMDVLGRYVESLLLSYDKADPVLASGVKCEIEHSKSLIKKLRNGLSRNAGDSSNSESETLYSSDNEEVAESHSAQVQRLTQELGERNRYINELRDLLESMNQTGVGGKAESRPLSTDTYTAGRWLDAPIQHSATPSSHAEDSSNHMKQQPDKLGKFSTLNVMTPSSHPSLRSAQEEELYVDQGESSRLPSVLTDHEDKFAALPGVLQTATQRLSWPLAQNLSQLSEGRSPRRSMPMYQKTIAVTEYLPPSVKARKDAKHSGSSTEDRLNRRRRLATNNDESECTASYGGAWLPATPHKNDVTPPKHRPSRFVASSCDDEIGDDEHRLSRELDRLRRRLSDSKRINRTLKEELELATKSLQRAKESVVPGYQRSPHRTTDMLAQHLSEIRGLRQRLEESIATNDRLRVKLEERLKHAGTGATDRVSANIYLSPESESPPSHNLQQRLHDLQDENDKLSDRLRSAEKDSVLRVSNLENQLEEKSSQTDVLAHHIEQLQRELQQQNQFSERLAKELASRDQQLRQLKARLEESEAEKQATVDGARREKDAAKRLRSEMATLQRELEESRNLIDTLKSEVALHEKLSRTNSVADHSDAERNLDLSELLQEIRCLRSQLERSIDANSALRRQLEEQLKGERSEHDPMLTTINIHHLSPRKSSRQNSPRSAQNSARRKLKLDVEGGSALMTPPASASSGAEDHQNRFFPNDQQHALNQTSEHSKDRPYFCKGGKYTMCKSDDFSRLQKNLLESGVLVHSMRDNVGNGFSQKAPDKKMLKELPRRLEDLLHRLARNDKLLEKFWSVDVEPTKSSPAGRTTSFSSSGVATGGHCSCSGSEVEGRRSVDDPAALSETDGLRREVGKLRHRLSTQDRLLQSTVERLHTTNRLKEGIENAIVEQLSRTHTVLRKARGNLEAKVQHSTRK